MIDLKEFKTQIENNTVDKNLIVFRCQDSTGNFIVHQYLRKYRLDNDYEVEHVDNLNPCSTSDLFNTEASIVKLYETPNLDIKVPLNNRDITWVICKKVDTRLTSYYEDVIIDVDKVEDWQVRDFAFTSCRGVDEASLTELVSTYKNNIFRLNNELEKISMFDENERNIYYAKIKDQLFVDTSGYSIFDIVNSIVRRDYSAMQAIYKEIPNIDVEPYGLLKLLIDNFKRIIDVQLGKNPSAESLGMSGKQFWAIQKYSCGFYSASELVSIFDMLNSVDFQIKTGYLDTKNVVDHLICRILLI